MSNNHVTTLLISVCGNEEGQNTCVSLFKGVQLNLVAVGKWSFSEEMRGIKTSGVIATIHWPAHL
jgi:hypothetical protein